MIGLSAFVLFGNYIALIILMRLNKHPKQFYSVVSFFKLCQDNFCPLGLQIVWSAGAAPHRFGRCLWGGLRTTHRRQLLGGSGHSCSPPPATLQPAHVDGAALVANSLSLFLATVVIAVFDPVCLFLVLCASEQTPPYPLGPMRVLLCDSGSISGTEISGVSKHRCLAINTQGSSQPAAGPQPGPCCSGPVRTSSSAS